MSKEYRLGAGAMILNNQNKVFVARRLDIMSGLQMPQGGIEHNEDHLVGILRELKEEISTDNFQLISKLNFPLYYDFPEELLKKQGEKTRILRYKGQKIYWFLLRFLGDDNDINTDTKHREFTEWCWTDVESLVDKVVFFKKGTYQTLLDAFKGLY